MALRFELNHGTSVHADGCDTYRTAFEKSFRRGGGDQINPFTGISMVVDAGALVGAETRIARLEAELRDLKKKTLGEEPKQPSGTA